MTAQDPETPDQWVEAMNYARLLRSLHDCKLYGLLTGGPDVNVRRCDWIMDEGRRRGHRPSMSVEQMIKEGALDGLVANTKG